MAAISNVVKDVVKDKESVNNSTEDCTLYTTTFPCENYTKHIIQAGIKKVIYIESYHKSRAEGFYSELITLEDKKDAKNKKIPFILYEGIGARIISVLEEKNEKENTKK